MSEQQQAALVVKKLLASAGDIRDTGRPLEEGMASHSSILVWKNPMDRGA